MVILRPSFLFVWTVCAVLRWAGLVDSWLPPPLGLLIVLWPRPTGCFFPLLPDWGFRPPLPEKFAPPEKKKKWNKNRGKVVLEEKKSSRSLTGKQIWKFQIPTWASRSVTSTAYYDQGWRKGDFSRRFQQFQGHNPWQKKQILQVQGTFALFVSKMVHLFKWTNSMCVVSSFYLNPKAVLSNLSSPVILGEYHHIHQHSPGT